MNIAEWLDLQKCEVCRKQATKAYRNVMNPQYHNDNRRFSTWHFGCDTHEPIKMLFALEIIKVNQ